MRQQIDLQGDKASLGGELMKHTRMPEPRGNAPQTGVASAKNQAISLQPMFVTNRTTITEIDEHLATADTRIVVVTIERDSAHGLNVVDHLGVTYSDIRVVLVCEGSAETILSLSFKPGVWACVSRQSSVETLREAIDQVAKGNRFVAQELTQQPKIQEHSSTPRPQTSSIEFSPTGGSTALTRRERQVLGLIAQGRPRREIAEILEVSPRTIDAYRARLLQKLGLDSSVQLVKYAISAGLTG